MTPSPTIDPLIGQNVGGYVIEGLLGEGGMGLVYRARHPILERRFAVKVLRPDVASDPTISQNFIREAQTLSALKHPNIVDIVGFGPLADGRQYMVTEFLDGRTVEHELIEYHQLPPLRALLLMDQVLSALAAAHAVDVVHRDLKPSNIFLARSSGGTEIVKLLDFGLAKQQPAMLAPYDGGVGRSVVAGTPEYVAPEQASGEQAGKYSDLYSLGITLYEMLTGARPFNPPITVDRVTTLMRMHMSTPAPLIGPAFPVELEQLVAELLNKQPADRPPSAEAVRSRLQVIRRELETKEGERYQHTATPRPIPIQLREPTPARLLPVPPPLEPSPSRALRLGAVLVGLVAVTVVALGLMQEPERAPDLDEPLTPTQPVTHGPVVVAPPTPAPSTGEELEALPVIPKPTRPAPPKPELAHPRPAPPPVVASAPEAERCEPDERWKRAARVHLQEVQQLIAAKDDSTLWAEFERREDEVSTAISAAATPAQCAQVDAKIRALARGASR